MVIEQTPTPTSSPIWDRAPRGRRRRRPQTCPSEAVGPFVNDDFGDVYSTVVMMTGDGFSWREMEDIAEDVRARLLRLDDAAKVEIAGVQPQRVYIEYDEARLADVGLSASHLATILESRNILLSGGDVRTAASGSSLSPRATSTRWTTSGG